MSKPKKQSRNSKVSKERAKAATNQDGYLSYAANTKDVVSISQAAEVLGVSIDTVRRWDKQGILHATRPGGKNRYFSVEELEKLKFSQPLSISEAAEQLNVSPSTLRRLEKKGLINPSRDDNGNRVYGRETLAKFLHSEYFVRSKEIEEQVLAPLTHREGREAGEAERGNHDPATHALLGEHHLHIDSLKRFRRVVLVSLTALAGTFILLIALLTLLFFLFPESTAKTLGYFKQVPASKKYVFQTPDSLVARQLRPFSQAALHVVEAVNPQLREKVAPFPAIEDVNDVLAPDAEGNITSLYTFTVPDTSYLRIPDKGLVVNLNSDYLRGRAPGCEEGDLAIVGACAGAVGGATVLRTIGGGGTTVVTSTTSGGGSGDIEGVIAGGGLSGGGTSGTVTLDIGEGDGIDVGANSIALRLNTSGSGLEVGSAGLSLLRSCAAGQLLEWSGSGWACAADDAGAGSQNVFTTIAGDGGTNPVADSVSDTLTLTGGNGLITTGAAGSDTITFDIDLLDSAGGAGISSSASGLQFNGPSNSELTLLQGCASDQILKWDSVNGLWQCAADATGGAGGTDLQGAYNTGNVIITGDDRDIDILLDDTTTDSNLDIDIADGSTSTVSISRLNGASSDFPAQLLLLENLDIDGTLVSALKITSAGGSISNAIDLSDGEIVNALNIGGNAIAGTNATINFIDSLTLAQTFGVSSSGTVTIGPGQSYTGVDAVTLSSGGGADLILDSSSGEVRFADTDVLHIGGLNNDAFTYNALANAGGSASHAAVSSDNDLYIQGDFEVDGSLFLDGPLIDATPVTTFNCSDCIDWDDISNAMTLDETTTSSLGANTFTWVINGAGNYVANLSSTGDFIIQDAGSTFLTISDTGAYSFTLDSTDNPAYTITNNGSSNVSTNLVGTGDFIIQDAGSTFLTISDTGAYSYTLDATDNPAYTITNNGTSNVTITQASTGDFVINQAAGANTQITATAAPTVDMLAISNSGLGTVTDAVDGLEITFVQAAVAGVRDNAGLRVSATSGSSEAGDTLEGIDIATLTSPSAGVETALRVGGGWDTGLRFNSNTITTDIVLQNDETIDNNLDGTLLFTAPTTQTSGIMLIGDGAGSDYLSFAEEAGNPAGCAIGEFRIWANATESLLKKCQNGALSDLDAAGSWNQITAPTGNLSLDHQEFTTAFTWDVADGTADALTYFTLASTNDAATDGLTQQLMALVNNDAGGAGVGTTETLLNLHNADTDEAVTDGLLVTAAAGGMTDAVDVSDSDIVNGVNIGSNNLAFTDGGSFSITDNAASPNAQFTFKDNTDANGGSVLNFARPKTTNANPATCTAGDIYFNGADETMMACTSTDKWEQLDNPASGFATEANGGETISGSTYGASGLTNTATIDIQYSGGTAATTHDTYITATQEFNPDGIFDGDIFMKIKRDTTNCADGNGTDASQEYQISSNLNTNNKTITISAVDSDLASVGSHTYSICIRENSVGGTLLGESNNIVLYELTTGADLAEVYYSQVNDLKPGEVVSVDDSLQAGVKRSTSAYERGQMGVVSTRPGHVLSDGSDDGHPVLVALTGRVPVKVSTENGPIKVGDRLTSSSKPGVAMKATKAGPVIGTSITSFSGGGEGEVVVFVGTGWYGGDLASLLPEGLFVEGSEPPADDVSDAILSSLKIQNTPVNSEALSEILADRIVAGMEVITPKVTTDRLRTNTLESLTGDGLDINLKDNEGLAIKDQSGQTVASVDAKGNAAFLGSLTAKDVEANQVVGTDIGERFYTNDDSITYGDVVAVDQSLVHGAAKSNSAYDKRLLGIVSTSPSLMVDEKDGDGRPIVVAASGTVSVKVNTEGGEIRAGDPLTSSSTPGVAMKATREGPIIGRAMGDFTGKEGTVLVRVANGYSAGSIREEVDSLGQRVDGLASDIEGLKNSSGSETTDNPEVLENLQVSSLTVALDLNVKGALVVDGPADFYGPTVFHKLVTFVERTIFGNDVVFEGRPTFNEDTAGFARIRAGEQKVAVTFTEEYAELPVVSVTLGEGKFASYSYDNLTTRGFEIVLEEPATRDLDFSWIALSIANAQTHVNAAQP